MSIAIDNSPLDYGMYIRYWQMGLDGQQKYPVQEIKFALKRGELGQDGGYA